MTSPELFVLYLALVCSIFSTASEQTADHGSKQANKLSHRIVHDDTNNTQLNMEIFRTNVNNHRLIDTFNFYLNNNNELKVRTKDETRDEFYNQNNLIITNLHVHREHLVKVEQRKKYMRQYNFNDNSKSKMIRRVKREDDEAKCEAFQFYKDHTISHPHGKNGSNNYYYNTIDCVTVINATEGTVIQLTFVDMFHIEDHPECAYDYLEIRDGLFGYARLLGKVCGEAFPPQITTSGPNVWLKFHSDDTIEYEGFHINVDFVPSASSHSIPETCYKTLTGMHGIIDSANIDPDCVTRSSNQALDVLWTIETPENTKIYLNFTTYSLAKPNECEDNVVQVFGSVLEFHAKLAHYCGSMANSVTTKGGETGKAGSNERGNIMYVRLFASKAAKTSAFNATFTAYRSLDPNKDEKCNSETEFDCEDNTCIAKELKCDKYAHCRLKADEDYELCKGETESIISQPHIMVILVIFSLILSGMSFVFLFKCIRKLYQDHKIIKEHIRQSCEDRLDNLIESRLTLDAKRLQLDSEPRASLERENHTNEMFKQQRSLSQHKGGSIDSVFIQETHIDLDEEPWRRDVESIAIETEEVRVERNGRRRSDMSKKEESIRSRTKETEGNKVKREIRDVSVGAPDTKESGCQTRESLFQAGTAPSSEGTESGTNSRGFSTFGYSGATLARPSPPAPTTNTSEITIELLRQVPHQDSVKSQKKMPDRRPMSTETTRSAPDVIIVSKPIR